MQIIWLLKGGCYKIDTICFVLFKESFLGEQAYRMYYKNFNKMIKSHESLKNKKFKDILMLNLKVYKFAFNQE
jgi:hypothetical protein